MNNALYLIFGVIALELVVIALLMVTALLIQVRKSGSRIRQHERLWEELLPGALDGEQSAVARIQASLRSRAVWKDFHGFVDDSLRDAQNRGMIGFRRLSRHVGLTEWLHQQLLHARDPLARAAAGKTLARLHERIAEEEILRLMGSKDTAVVLAAAHGVAFLRDRTQFLPVFRAVYDRTPITLHGAAELLSGFGEGVCTVIHELLDGVLGQYRQTAGARDAAPLEPQKEVDRNDIAAQVVMADLLAHYRYHPAAPTLARLLEFTENEEVLIHLVKALAVVGDHSAVPRLIELLAHPSWVVRRQSTQALSVLGAGEAAASVQTLLADSHLTVRASALEALQVLLKAETRANVGVLEAVS